MTEAMGNAVSDRVRLYYEYLDKGKIKNIFPMFTEDIIFYRPGPEKIEGISEFKDFYLNKRRV